MADPAAVHRAINEAFNEQVKNIYISLFHYLVSDHYGVSVGAKEAQIKHMKTSLELATSARDMALEIARELNAD